MMPFQRQISGNRELSRISPSCHDGFCRAPYLLGQHRPFAKEVEQIVNIEIADRNGKMRFEFGE